MCADRILKFGEMFQVRLDSSLLQGTLDYVACNEESLAFEILCDHVCEYNVLITESEYREAMQLALDMGFDVKAGPFKHLIGLKL
ncbi:MafI family immunity protein [Pseudomonas sp. BLCC-B112]|uniref:MafI family immunity protein n=1 Tax=Pseudomonas sp. BLCC-B112 TaxID=3025319 RepID=UPI00234D1561|nr:MafI family immunity protein [Pseudomonas sp. BLCC-B112]MDC7813886.1 MafI family immunity protein [Pseudomonas sp. BLCC-B112]